MIKRLSALPGIALLALLILPALDACNAGNTGPDKMPDSIPNANDTVPAATAGNDAQFPGTAPVCYESSYAGTDPDKRIQLHEYIQLWNENGKVTGRGAGESEGSPDWIFTFNGSMLNDTTIQVKADYSREGQIALHTSETWIIDRKKARMHLAAAVPGRPGADAYFEIDAGDLPGGMLKLMQGK